MLSSVFSEKQKTLQEYISVAAADSTTSELMAKKACVYLLLMKLKGFRNRTFLLIKSEIPQEKEQLLLSVQFSKHQKGKIKEIKKKWAKESRGVKGRLRKGIELAVLYRSNFQVYDKDK